MTVLFETVIKHLKSCAQFLETCILLEGHQKTTTQAREDGVGDEVLKNTPVDGCVAVESVV